MKEGVTTLPGSLGVNPPQWTTAHKDVPPEWLSQEGHPCSIQGRPGVMQTVNGKLVCVPTPKESIKMDATVITEGTNLHFTSASRTQIAKAHVYFDVRRRQVGLDNVRVSKIQGVQGNWFFDVSSHENNQFLDPNRLHNILPADVTVTASAPPTPQTASQDEVRNAVREMVEEQFDKLNQIGESEDIHERSSKVLDSNEIRFKNGTHRISLEQSDGTAHSIHHSFRPNADMLHPSPSWHDHGTVLAGTDEKRARNLFFHAVHSAKASHSMGGE